MYLPSEWSFWYTFVRSDNFILGRLLALCIGLIWLLFVLAFLDQVLVLIGKIGILNLDNYGANVAILKVQAEALRLSSRYIGLNLLVIFCYLE